MSVKLGSTDVSFRLGEATPSKVYLGSAEVWSAGSPPGAPSNLSFSSPDLYWTVPEDAGTSPITDYRVYVNNVLTQVEAISLGGSASFGESSLPTSGDQIAVSAVNSAGEGPKSASLTVP